jgi:hypothetical protein
VALTRLGEGDTVVFDGAVMNGGNRPFSGEHGALRSNERLPTDAEAARLLPEMSPELAAMFQAARLLNVRCVQLSGLQIDLVDFRRKSIVLDDRSVTVSDEVLRHVKDAMGDRRSGHVFLTVRRKPWNMERIKVAFLKVKKLTNIGRDGGERVLI